MMAEQKLGDTGFLLLMTPTGTIMYADDESLMQTAISDADIDEAVKQGLIINNAKELILKNVNITGCEGEPVVTGNVDKIIK